jgi:Tfp pilus assembly protein PilN
VQDCDFIPARYHEAKALRRAVKVRATFIGIMIAIMVLWGVAHQHHLAEVQALIADVDRQQEQVTLHMAKKQSMEAERGALRDQQRLLDRLQGNASLVVLFGDISRRLPDAVVLVELSVQCGSLCQYAAEEEPGATPDKAKAQVGRQLGGQRSSLSYPQRSSLSYQTEQDERGAVDHVTLRGIAREIRDAIEFAAGLEGSRLLDKVELEMKRPTTWGGRTGHAFELRCRLVKQARGRP